MTKTKIPPSRSLDLPPSGFRARRKEDRFAAFALFVVSLLASPAHAQQALPIVSNKVLLTGPTDRHAITVDLSTVPERPALLIEVTGGSSHPAATLRIEVTNWIGTYNGPGACPFQAASFPTGGPETAVGNVTLELGTLIACEPRIDGGFWNGKEVDVIVDAISAGPSATYPVSVDISIRGITRVPTRQSLFEVESTLTPESIVLTPNKDTVLYQGDQTATNGGGYYLWAGTDYSVFGFPPFQVRLWNRLNSLIAFDIPSSVPFNAIVTNADLSLYTIETLGGGGTVHVYPAFETSPSTTWIEGNGDGAGTEFTGESTPLSSAANWNFRQGDSEPWGTPGGDYASPPAASLGITSTGFKVFSSAGLDAAVQTMIDERNDRDGFVLVGPRNVFYFGDQAIRFLSSDYVSAGFRPTLRLDYTPSAPYAEGQVQTGAVSFIGEGSDFHWIYDDDDDGIYVTPISGVCEAVDYNPNQGNYLPYTYDYQGSPGYVGVDCCTWQIDSSQTGTTGVGEALFFHGLDSDIPGNMPPDSDSDGIADLCDNCPAVPNGPAIGSCVTATGVATLQTCLSNGECATGEVCNLSQQDADLDFVGDACPEPGFGLGLLLGTTGLSVAVRRRARSAN